MYTMNNISMGQMEIRSLLNHSSSKNIPYDIHSIHLFIIDLILNFLMALLCLIITSICNLLSNLMIILMINYSILMELLLLFCSQLTLSSIYSHLILESLNSYCLYALKNILINYLA
jgi:type IV secretory pathway TrbL component